MLTQIQIEIYAHHAHMRHTERERETNKQTRCSRSEALIIVCHWSVTGNTAIIIISTSSGQAAVDHQTEVKTMKANQRKSTQGLSDRERAFKSQAWQFCMGNRRGWSWCFEWCIIEWGPGARERETVARFIGTVSSVCGIVWGSNWAQQGIALSMCLLLPFS